jgi:hypothetical protein
VPVDPGPDVPPDVLDFIRFCYRRRGLGWPEIYDEMCAVAARGLYRDLDYERLEALGVGFSLAGLPRLASLVQWVVAQERARIRAERAAVEARGTTAGARAVKGTAELPSSAPAPATG